MRPIILAPIACLALALAAVALAAPWGRPALSPDSIVFYEVAEMLLAGEGLVFRPEQPGAAPIPLTAWAPGYPVVLATVVTLLGASLDGAATLINVLALWAVTWLVYCLLAGRVGRSWAATVTVLLALAHPVQNIAAFAWSEALFMVFPLLAFAAMERYLARGRPVWLFAAGLAAVGGAFIRHAGVPFLVLVPLTALLRDGIDGRRRFFLALCAALGEFVLMAPLWWRNMSLAGTMSGSARGGSGELARVPEDVATIARFVEMLVFAGDTVLSSLFFWPSALLIGYGMLRITKQRQCKSDANACGLVLAWVAAYVAFVLAARVLQKEIEPPGARMLGVVWPLLAVGFGRVAWSAWQVMQHLPCRAGLLAVLALYCYSTWAHASRVRENWTAYGSPGYMLTFGTTHVNYRPDSRDAGPLLKAAAGRDLDASYVDSLPHVMAYLTRKPSYRWTAATGCDDLARAGRSGVIVVAPGPALARAAECVASNPGWRYRRRGE